MKAQKYKFKGSTYHLKKSWDYNYDHGPKFKGPYPPLPKEKKWFFLGYPVISPLGIAAGPLPNAKWLIPYAKLGFGSLIQKTVRSSAHPCHPYPNILEVKVNGKLDLESTKPLIGSKNITSNLQKLSITNSFGNPCREPKLWAEETTKTRKLIKTGQVFGVSVYGTAEENTSLNQLAQDYAKTASMAKKAGAMFIEANLACPNVKGSENPNLYKDAKAVRAIVLSIKSKIGKTPLALKIGYFEKYQDLLQVFSGIKGKFEGVSAINTISKKVVDKNGKQILPGRDVSGVCGFAIKDYGIKTVKNLAKARKYLNHKFEIIGVGGVMTPKDVVDYLKAGADHVHSATAIMWNPYLAYELSNNLQNNDGKTKSR